MAGNPKALPPRALTIAGSDSGGGAGIQADLKTFTALKVYGMSVITSLTAQNTTGVLEIQNLPPSFVSLQLKAVCQDIGVDAVKTGMLSRREIIEAVVEGIKKWKIPRLVVDPVLLSKSGEALLQEEAIEPLTKLLLPLSEIVTPNIPEAELLSGVTIKGKEGMKEAAKKIKDLGPSNVLVKGGHLKDSTSVLDLFWDGRSFGELVGERINTRNTHGTGCTYSAAITAYLARGEEILEAVRKAREFVRGAIRRSFPLGEGWGPVNHFWSL